MYILGIESSCDETAAAVLRLDEAGPRVLSDVVLGQAAQYLRSLDWDPRAPAVVADPNWSGRSGLWWIPRGGAPLADLVEAAAATLPEGAQRPLVLSLAATQLAELTPA